MRSIHYFQKFKSFISTFINKKTSALTIAIILFSFYSVSAQLKPELTDDSLFPGKGKSMFTLATGIPYVGIAEYAFGFSDKFAVGLIYGQTPVTAGYGLRLRAILFQRKDNFKISLRAPIIYYPKRTGIEPWVLTWLSANAEWRLPSGLRFHGGIGAVGVECMDDIWDFVTLKKLSGPEHSHEHEHNHESEEENSMGKIWNTIQMGFSLPISKKMVFQTEASIVMDGFKVAGKDWIGGPRTIITIGIAYKL
ncbi:MAG: hypothetical protein NXI23_00075 [Bacteroidetes bacterium]|nr:hypothetical protein [Bacteroidota bacterium]MDF1865914.1 hypothetical protein [Saprospiraceae bacterium]